MRNTPKNFTQKSPKASSKHTFEASPHEAQKHIAPRKDLGQNFLRDGNIARNIVRALDVQTDDVVIEIGPGEGALTKLLMDTGVQALIAVEFDARAVEMLHEKFAPEIAAKRLHIVQSDVLKTSIDGLLAKVMESGISQKSIIKIIGNIPYYITSDILFWLFDEWARLSVAGEQAPERAVIMMQKEVAERITAKQRTKEYGILSVASLLVSVPKVLFHVAPSCFFPPPKVTSSVVEFRMKSHAHDAEAFQHTQPLVRAAFNQRRKMLSNALHGVLSGIAAKEAERTTASIIALAEERGLSYFRKRAEELSQQDFIALTAFLREL